MAADVFPPDYTTELGTLRALIPDVEQADFNAEGDPAYLFTDAQLGAYLSLYANATTPTARIKRASADALTAIAVSEALISKVIKTEDLQTDGAKLANALLAAANRRRAEADDDEEQADDAYGFEIVDYRPYPVDLLPVGMRGYPYGVEARSCLCAGACGCGSADLGAGFGKWV